MTDMGHPVELLDEDVDVELEQLAARDSWPAPARVRRKLREAREARERASVAARARARADSIELVDRILESLKPTPPEELERLRAELDRQEAERVRASEREALRMSSCPHEVVHLEGGVDVCRRCGMWRRAE